MIRIMVAAPTRIYREGLAEVLGGRAGYEIIGTASTRAECVDRVQRTEPDVVLVDFRMPAGPAIVRRVISERPELNVIMVGVPNVEEDVIACAEAGAGYVSCDASIAELVDAIDCAARGELLCSPKIARALVRRISSMSAIKRHSVEVLTGRECEVAELLSLGLSNKEIGRRLHISVSTVKIHVSHILEKLNVQSRTQAAALIYERGIRAPKLTHKSKDLDPGL